jgi:hypothetical protein
MVLSALFALIGGLLAVVLASLARLHIRQVYFTSESEARRGR